MVTNDFFFLIIGTNYKQNIKIIFRFLKLKYFGKMTRSQFIFLYITIFKTIILMYMELPYK